MSGQRVIAPGAGELVGDSPDRRVEILCDDDRLHATWSRFGPGREGADLHVHRRHTDLFYVLEGELAVRLGPEGTEVTVAAGALARVPPLVVHGFRNAGDTEVSYLNLHAPGSGFADFMRALRDGRTLAYDQEPPPTDGGRPPTEAAIETADAPIVSRSGAQVAELAELEPIAVAEVRAAAGEGWAPDAAPGGDDLRCLYVLEGEIEVGGERAPAGAWVRIADGATPAVTVASPQPARLLDLRAPGIAIR